MFMCVLHFFENIKHEMITIGGPDIGEICAVAASASDFIAVSRMASESEGFWHSCDRLGDIAARSSNPGAFYNSMMPLKVEKVLLGKQMKKNSVS